jgi:hypothetical protein
MNANTGARKMSQKEMIAEAKRIAQLEARMIEEGAPTSGYISRFNEAFKNEYNRLAALNEKKN